MKDKPLDPRALDVAAFCRQGGTLQGEWPLTGMDRLTDSFAAASDGAVRWALTGGLRPVRGGAPEPWISLAAEADVPLQCQRCLQPLTEKLVVDRRFHFVATEELAAEIDEEAEDEDVLALPARLDVVALLEDELILALPIVPRHETCPEPLPLPAEPEEEAPAPHPFAALAALKIPGKAGS